jgi:hypothetical protein
MIQCGTRRDLSPREVTEMRSCGLCGLVHEFSGNMYAYSWLLSECSKTLSIERKNVFLETGKSRHVVGQIFTIESKWRELCIDVICR